MPENGRASAQATEEQAVRTTIEECLGKLRFDLKPRVRRTFGSLRRRLFPPLQCRTNEASRLEGIHSGSTPRLDAVGGEY